MEEAIPLAGFGMFGILILFAIVINLVLIVFWLWMLIDCATKEPSEGNDKVIWILILIFTGWIGGLIYFFVRRPQWIAQFGQ